MAQSAIITVIGNAARKAARGVVRDFGEIDKLQISRKGVANYVTNADLRADKILIEELGKARPRFSFLTEESGQVGNPQAQERFVIDPIDGTTNFIHAVPYIAISIALQRRAPDGWQTTAGVVYDPIHDEMFHAEHGRGAFVNGARLSVSRRRDDLLVATSAPRKSRKDFEQATQTFARVAAAGVTLRCNGSAALDLAYVAAGRLDACWYSQLNAWDMLAGALLVSEAGGSITATDGAQVIRDGKGSVLASSGKIHASMRKLLTPPA